MKPRHIRIIEKLPISELTDEEIAKAALHRLDAKAVMLIYGDEDMLTFLGRYRNGGSPIATAIKRAYEKEYGKLFPIKNDDKE